MAYFKDYSKLCYIAQVILGYVYLTLAEKTVIKGNLPDPSIIHKLFNDFLGPVMRSIPKINVLMNDFQETLVDKAIRGKIEELQPLLQDNDMTDDENIMLEVKDDTTILEFLPKTEERKNMIEEDPIQSHLRKYKKIREKINKALAKESVSEKTINLVVKTLDGLIKYLLSSQCKWKRNLRAVNPVKPSDIANKWNTGLQNIKDVLLNLIQNRSIHTRRNDDVLKFLNAIQIMFRSITEDVDVISKKYKILCDFVPKEHISVMKPEDMNVNALRNNWDKSDVEEDILCHNVVVCSNELKEFMRNFYLTLNDTALSVIQNYEEMYTRDVVVDNENDKDVIISVLNKMTTDLEEGLSKVFVQETQKLLLDKDKKNQANVNILSNYVASTIKSVTNFAKQLLKSELLVLREKILTVILDDLNVNLDVDLGNLEREFIRKICAMFRLCNGRYRGRRHGSSNLSKNNLHLQVQLTLANDIADINSYRKNVNVVNSRNNTDNRFTSYMRNVTVTRTTLINNVTNSLLNK